MNLAIAGYLSVQSLSRRVRICALPETSRVCIRYPSNLISCSQSEPSGALLTSAASCGLIQAGGEAGLTLRRGRERVRRLRASGFHHRCHIPGVRVFLGASCRECVQFSRPWVAADRARADFIAGRFAKRCRSQYLENRVPSYVGR